MSEGELKKRFRINGGYFDEDYEMKEFIIVVDEAAREFPTYKNTKVSDIGNLRSILMAKRTQWFKKWFGEPSTKKPNDYRDDDSTST